MHTETIAVEDISPMHDAGKDRVYVIILDSDDVHEDDAGLRLGRSAAVMAYTFAVTSYLYCSEYGSSPYPYSTRHYEQSEGRNLLP